MYLNKYNLEICSQQRIRNRVAIPFNSETKKTQEDKFLEPQYNLEIPTEAINLNLLRQF